MGITSPDFFAQLLPTQSPYLSSTSSNATTSSAPPPASSKALTSAASEQATTDLLGKNQAADVDEAFEGAVYYSKMKQVSLAARFQQVAAQISNASSEKGEETTVGFKAQQMEFSFFAESRTEELVRFNQRTQEVAQGLQGAQKSSYAELSQQVSARFEMSITISGAALQGFAGASEGTVDMEALFGDFMEMAQGLLDASDDLFNEIFSLFGDGAKTDSDTLNNMVKEFTSKLLENDFAGIFQTSEAGGEGENALLSQNSASMQSMQLEISFELNASVRVQQGVVQQSDPIILDLDGDGYEMTSYRDGAKFDLLGTGQEVNTAFVTGGDAFLAIDRNGDGIVNSGKELFGDQNGAANGFEELRKLDSNNDGLINREDDDFEALRLFKDNGNGITEEGELVSLAEAGIEEIDLGYFNVNQRAAGGNRLAQIASFRRSDGTQGKAADAILNYTA